MSPDPCPVANVSPAPHLRSAVRWLFAGLGVACFALGAVGAVVPGLPTTVFLLAGSYFLTRSCPWLERRLRESAFLRPYSKYLDPTVPMPWSAKRRALAAMWTSIAAATAWLAWQGTAPSIVVAAIPMAGVVGTVAIVRFRRGLETRAAGGGFGNVGLETGTAGE